MVLADPLWIAPNDQAMIRLARTGDVRRRPDVLPLLRTRKGEEL
jgi:hypothetical protein